MSRVGRGGPLLSLRGECRWRHSTFAFQLGAAHQISGTYYSNIQRGRHSEFRSHLVKIGHVNIRTTYPVWIV